MSETKRYEGSCHCGRVRFEAQLDLTQSVTACNCSICSRAGWLLAFAPTERFTLLEGGDAMTDYQFGKQRIHHAFCATCGVRPFSRGVSPNGQDVFAVNVRCLAGVEPDALTIKPFDGRSL
jgi:hypothetical protein